MEEPKNRMEQAPAKKTRGRPRKKYPKPEVVETKPSKIRCNRCGHVEDVKVRKTVGQLRLHWCSGCGEWLDISS